MKLREDCDLVKAPPLENPQIQDEVHLISSALGVKVFVHSIEEPNPAELPTCALLEELARARSPEAAERLRKSCRRFHACMAAQAAGEKKSVQSKCHFGLFSQTWPLLGSAALSVAGLRPAPQSPPLGSTVFEPERLKSMATLIQRSVERINHLSTALQESLSPEEKAMLWLERKACEPLNWTRLAQAAGVSRQHLYRLWAKRFGESVGSSLARLRIHRASELLRASPHRKILDIAMECGFGSLSQFNRIFHKLQGCTPTEFRCRSQSA